MSAPTQEKRLDVRVSAGHKELIEQAAGLLGQSVSAFTVSTLVREARDVVDRFTTIRLTDRDRDAFLAALDNPPKPNARVRRVAREYARRVCP